MIVVSDTSPLNYLILIQTIDILPSLFKQVIAPSAILEELNHPRSPEAVRDWATRPPNWLMVQNPSRITPASRLDLGEAAAIALAEELRADILLIDEKDGRQAARVRGLQVVGTLGVLERAALLDLIDLPSVLHRLQTTNFHVHKQILQKLLHQDRARRQQTPEH